MSSCPEAKAFPIELQLREVTRRISDSPASLSVVFDNIDFDGSDLPEQLRSLAGATILVVRRGGCVIVISKRPLPQLFRRELSFPDAAYEGLPLLEQEEVAEFCALAGCQDERQRILWAPLIWLQTHGHPQLVHARVSVLARLGWPPPTADQLLSTPKEIREEQALARQLLCELDGGQRELLYRLGIGQDRSGEIMQLQPEKSSRPFPILVTDLMTWWGRGSKRLEEVTFACHPCSREWERLIGQRPALVRCGMPLETACSIVNAPRSWKQARRYGKLF